MATWQRQTRQGRAVEYVPVVYAAAKTLAIIGGPQELGARDAWLRGPSQRDDELRQHVQRCRDALKERRALEGLTGRKLGSNAAKKGR